MRSKVVALVLGTLAGLVICVLCMSWLSLMHLLFPPQVPDWIFPGHQAWEDAGHRIAYASGFGTFVLVSVGVYVKLEWFAS